MIKRPHLPAGVKALTHKFRLPMSRDKADTLLLLAACLLVLAPHAAHLPLWVTLTCAMALLWRGWVTFRGNRMPSRWLLLPIAAAAMVGVYWEYKRVLGKDPGVAMLVLLIAFKLLEMHAKRDLFAVVFVSFFIMLTNFFYSQTIVTALMMVAAVIAILSAQLSFQYTGVVPPLKQRLGLGALIFALAVPLTLVLFILFPRIQGPLWGMPSDSVSGRSGLSDTMSPGNISNLALSDEVAFRVKFIDPAPVKSKRYWRGVVLGNYDGSAWTQLRTRAESSQSILINLRGAPIRHQVTLEPNGRRWLFALELPQAAPRLVDNPSGVTSDMQLLANRPINQRVRYDVSSYVDFDLQPTETSAALRDWLNLPTGYNPETLAFAARLRSQSSGNSQLVNAVLKFFRTEKFSYTLQPPPLGRDAVDEFLFTTRAGFCEHYAGAFVVIMRALGIPARVVVGYQGGEINPVDGFMTVRQSDAHAWAEVWLENRGWVRVDPTAAVAPDRIEMDLRRVIPRRAFGGLISINSGPNSLLSTLRVNLDAVNNAWNQWVLDYTPDKQKSLVRSMGFDEVDWRLLTALMLACGSVVVALAVLPLLIHRKKTDPINAVYADLCREMARHGLARAIHEGPRAYGARLSAENSPLAPRRKAAVACFLKLYEATQYGAASQTSQSAIVSELKSLFVECR
jgi:transglutaminase-like putative cysteine protease